MPQYDSIALARNSRCYSRFLITFSFNLVLCLHTPSLHQSSSLGYFLIISPLLFSISSHTAHLLKLKTWNWRHCQREWPIRKSVFEQLHWEPSCETQQFWVDWQASNATTVHFLELFMFIISTAISPPANSHTDCSPFKHRN